MYNPPSEDEKPSFSFFKEQSVNPLDEAPVEIQGHTDEHFETLFECYTNSGGMGSELKTSCGVVSDSVFSFTFFMNYNYLDTDEPLTSSTNWGQDFLNVKNFGAIWAKYQDGMVVTVVVNKLKERPKTGIWKEEFLVVIYRMEGIGDQKHPYAILTASELGLEDHDAYRLRPEVEHYVGKEDRYPRLTMNTGLRKDPEDHSFKTWAVRPLSIRVVSDVLVSTKEDVLHVFSLLDAPDIIKMGDLFENAHDPTPDPGPIPPGPTPEPDEISVLWRIFIYLFILLLFLGLGWFI